MDNKANNTRNPDTGALCFVLENQDGIVPLSAPHMWRLTGPVSPEQSRVALAGELVWRSKFSSPRSQAPGLKPTVGT